MNNLINITDIAKVVGLSGRTLNRILKEQGIIYKSDLGKKLWLPTSEYEHLVPAYCDFEFSTSKYHNSRTLKWTELGKKFIIEEVLKMF